MFSPLEAKTRTFLKFKEMSFPDEKARAHAEISEEDWPQVEQEIERLRTTPEERAARQLEGRFQAIEAKLAKLEEAVDYDLKIYGTRLLQLDNRTEQRFKTLEARSASQPRSSSLPKQRKKPNLSQEERQRRSDRMKQIQLQRRLKQHTEPSGV